MQIESQKGNTVTRNADEENPAVRVERQGDGNNQDVVKRMSELTKVGEGREKEGEVGVGEKRAREEMEQEHKAGEGEQVAEPQDEKATEDKEPETKKTRLDERKPGRKSRGRGRGRGKTAAATTTGARRGGRPKRESRKKTAD